MTNLTAARLAALALVLMTLAGCGSDTTGPGSASVRAQAPPTRAGTAVSTVPGELTRDEALRVNPSPPRNIRTRVMQGTVVVTWDDPPVATVPHSYSDRVVSFRVYRRGPGQTEMQPLAVVSGHRYVDSTVRRGLTYEYAATSIREHQVEGQRSQAEVIALP